MNKWLVGNGYWCPDCNGTGEGRITDTIVYDSGAERHFRERCRTCDGQRRLPNAAAGPEGGAG